MLSSGQQAHRAMGMTAQQLLSKKHWHIYHSTWTVPTLTLPPRRLVRHSKVIRVATSSAPRGAGSGLDMAQNNDSRLVPPAVQSRV